MIGYLVYPIVGKIRKSKSSPVNPNGIDVNKPVENPELVKAIEATFLLTERTVPAYDFYKKNGYYEYPDTVAFSKGFGPKYE